MQNEISLSGLVSSLIKDDGFKQMMQKVVKLIDSAYSDPGPEESKADLLTSVHYLHSIGFRDSLVRFVEASDKSKKYCAGDVVQCFPICPAYDSEHGECSIDMTRDAALDVATAPLLLCDAIIKYLYDAYHEEIEKLPLYADDEPDPESE